MTMWKKITYLPAKSNRANTESNAAISMSDVFFVSFVVVTGMKSASLILNCDLTIYKKNLKKHTPKTWCFLGGYNNNNNNNYSSMPTKSLPTLDFESSLSMSSMSPNDDESTTATFGFAADGLGLAGGVLLLTIFDCAIVDLLAVDAGVGVLVAVAVDVVVAAAADFAGVEGFVDAVDDDDEDAFKSLNNPFFTIYMDWISNFLSSRHVLLLEIHHLCRLEPSSLESDQSLISLYSIHSERECVCVISV